MPLLIRFLALIGLLGAVSPVMAREPASDAAARASLPEWVEFLRLPNVPTGKGTVMRANADWLETHLARRGFAVERLGDPDAPAVFAQSPAARRGAPTILFYAHFDGQAVDAAQWDQADPFEPVLKEKDAAGRWQPVPMARLAEAGPEWRLFARSAADDKAPIVMLLAAIDALRAEGGKPTVRVKILLDPEEESGSAGLDAVVRRHAALLAADAVVMLDGPLHASNRPTIVFGHRSVATFTLTVFGARGELHSGHYGNFAPNPARDLAALIGSFTDGQGRVAIPGFYDGVDLGPGVRAALGSVPEDEPAMLARLGIARPDRVGRTYQEALAYPSLNVIALSAADVAHPRTIIPASATAKFDIRTVPGTPGDRQIALVRRFVEAQGFHLVDGVPTEEDRRTYPRLAAISGSGGTPALATSLTSPVGTWAATAIERTFGTPPVRIPMMGGSVPSWPLVDGLKAPVLLLPLVNPDNNQHAANENMRLGNYFDGVRTLLALLKEPYPAQR